MQNNYFKYFIITFVALLAFQGLYAYSNPSGAPGSSTNSVPPMDGSTADNYKYAGLDVKTFSTGDTGMIVVNQSGNVGVKTTTAPSDVRMYVNGTVKIKSLAGTGTRRLCGGATGSSADGYALAICP